jgi:hypothetical protein
MGDGVTQTVNLRDNRLVFNHVLTIEFFVILEHLIHALVSVLVQIISKFYLLLFTTLFLFRESCCVNNLAIIVAYLVLNPFKRVNEYGSFLFFKLTGILRIF